MNKKSVEVGRVINKILYRWRSVGGGLEELDKEITAAASKGNVQINQGQQEDISTMAIVWQ